MDLNININDICEVVLTKEGLEVYRRSHPILKLPDLRALRLRMTLWDLMNRFGPSMYPGSDQLFENNRIQIMDRSI